MPSTSFFAKEMPHRPTVCSIDTNIPEQESTFQEKYYVGNKLGKGSFGQVYIAERVGERHGNDKRLAVKVLDLRVPQRGQLKCVENEISVWSLLSSMQHCVRLHEVFRGDGLVYMVMEKCDSSVLVHLDRMGVDLNERSLGEMFAQMLKGVRELHSLNVVHCDIKPDNFFVSTSDCSTVPAGAAVPWYNQGITIKLGDFGLAKSTKDSKLSGECGTPPFMCPEMIADQGYDEKADMWSFGVLVHVLLFGRFPYDPEKRSIKAMRQAILTNSKKPDFGSEIPLSASAISFSLRLLNRDPCERVSSAEALKSNYMTAVMNHSHEAGADLPSLRPVFRLAVKRAQAFEHRPLITNDLDSILDRLQFESSGVYLSETSETQSLNSISDYSSLIERSADCDSSFGGYSTQYPADSCETPTKTISMSDDTSAESFNNVGSWTCSV